MERCNNMIAEICACSLQKVGELPLQVHDLVMAAVLAAEPELHSAARMHVPHRTSCFEVSHPTGVITT